MTSQPRYENQRNLRIVFMFGVKRTLMMFLFPRKGQARLMLMMVMEMMMLMMMMMKFMV